MLKLKQAGCDRYSPALAYGDSRFSDVSFSQVQEPVGQPFLVLHCAIAFKFIISTNLVSKKVYKTTELAKIFKHSDRTIRWYLKANGAPKPHGRPKKHPIIDAYVWICVVLCPRNTSSGQPSQPTSVSINIQALH